MQTWTEVRTQFKPFMRLQKAILGGAALILLVMAGLGFGNWQEYRSAREKGLRVLAVQNSLDALVSTLLEAEAGQRGFLLTGDTRFLEPYNRALRQVPPELDRLAGFLRSPRGDANASVVRLKSLVDQQMRHTAQIVELRKRAGPEAAAEVLSQGTSTIDEIRHAGSEIRRHIESERSAVQSLALAANRGALLVTVTGGAILLALLGVGYMMIGRRTVDREEALSAMGSLHELGVRLTQSSDLHSLLNEILLASESITHADMGNIQLLDGSVLRIAAQHGFSAEFLDFFQAIGMGEGACGKALAARERIVAADIETDPIFRGTDSMNMLLAAGVRAVQATPMIGASGNVVGMLSTHYRKPWKPSGRDLQLLDLLARQAADVIEKFRAGEALRRSEERYRATFDNAAVGIAHVGLDGRWIQFNDAVCAVTGYSREELSSLTFAEITHPDDIETDLKLVRRVLSGEIQTFNLEKRYIRKDGTPVWVNLTVSLLRDASGAPQHYVSVIEDINERKEAEKELRTTKEQLQLVADNMAAAVSRCGRDLRYIWVSREYAAWLDCPAEKIAGRPIAEVIGARGYEDIRPHVERVLSGEKVEHTTQVSLPGGRRRWIHSVYVPTYAHQEEVDGFIAVDLDVTEEKRTAEQLRQTQRLESLGVLAGGIAHDFNNLLVGVLGNASFALEVLGPTTLARQMLEDVIAASERAAALTRQLLAYAGKEQLATRPIDLAALITELTGLLRASVPKNVHLALDLRQSLPFVDADQTQLQQVIMNLVINGAEAIPENSPGTVKITASVRKPTAEDHMHALAPLPVKDEFYVVLTVTDTGQGMTPEIQSRIFDPFFTTKFAGRGLGLSAVLGIVNSHRGAITLKTAPQGGTTITLMLPPSHRTAPRDMLTPVQAARAGGTVLVVDDEATVRTVAKRILEHEGYQVLAAENGREAIRVARAHPEIVAVLLDLAMPDMTGDQAAPQLHRINPAAAIVLSSGYAEGEARRKFDGAGISSFLQKPYRATTLLERLASHLSSPAPGSRKVGSSG
jgi:two-component system, cell cycle sensor histidine kinase and response regulator CckA